MKDSERLFSIPILIYTDKENSADGFACLGSGVIDCITRPFISEIIKNRILNAIAFTDSLTFYGIEKMLKELPSNIFLKDNECKYVFVTKYWSHQQCNGARIAEKEASGTSDNGCADRIGQQGVYG